MKEHSGSQKTEFADLDTTVVMAYSHLHPDCSCANTVGTGKRHSGTGKHLR